MLAAAKMSTWGAAALRRFRTKEAFLLRHFAEYFHSLKFFLDFFVFFFSYFEGQRIHSSFGNHFSTSAVDVILTISLPLY